MFISVYVVAIGFNAWFREGLINQCSWDITMDVSVGLKISLCFTRSSPVYGGGTENLYNYLLSNY